MLSNTTKYIIALSATIVLLVVLFTIKLTPPNTTKAGGRGNAEEQSSNNEVAFNEDKYIETATKELAANEQEQSRNR